MNTQIIMVQIADRAWTQEAFHAACRAARQTGASIALVHMIPVQHAQWLGSDLAYLGATAQAKDDAAGYQATVEDYGLACIPVLFQYDSWVEGTLQAIDHVDAAVIYAPKPNIALPLWGRFQLWTMQHYFARTGRQWISEPNLDSSELVGSQPILRAATP